MKVLYVSTISNTVNTFMIPHIELLLQQGYEVDIACNIKNEISTNLTNQGCKVFNVEFQRSPFNKKNYNAYRKIKEIINNGKYNAVHTHTPVASACVRLACKNMNNVKTIYTAHGFHFFKGAPLLNWLLYYPIEKYLSKYTDMLITINLEDFNRAKKSLNAKNNEYIPGVGFETNKYKNVRVNFNEKRSEIGVSENGFLILSVGEVNKNKNHEVIIDSLGKLNMPDVYYVICGKGKLIKNLKKKVSNLGLNDRVIFLGYRVDIPEICTIADAFAFPSKREGLGLSALEAMATGLPIITSDVHGILDYSKNDITGYNCKPNDVGAFTNSIERMYIDSEKRYSMSLHNKEAVSEFDINNVRQKLTRIYSKVFKD